MGNDSHAFYWRTTRIFFMGYWLIASSVVIAMTVLSCFFNPSGVSRVTHALEVVVDYPGLFLLRDVLGLNPLDNMFVLRLVSAWAYGIVGFFVDLYVAAVVTAQRKQLPSKEKSGFLGSQKHKEFSAVTR